MVVVPVKPLFTPDRVRVPEPFLVKEPEPVNLLFAIDSFAVRLKIREFPLIFVEPPKYLSLAEVLLKVIEPPFIVVEPEKPLLSPEIESPPEPDFMKEPEPVMKFP